MRGLREEGKREGERGLLKRTQTERKKEGGDEGKHILVHIHPTASFNICCLAFSTQLPLSRSAARDVNTQHKSLREGYF